MRCCGCGWPRRTQLVRLDDAGMSVQMAEFVCHAVIRHFRELDGYEADVRAGKWSYRRPRAARGMAGRRDGAGRARHAGGPGAAAASSFRSTAGAARPSELAGVRCFAGREQLRRLPGGQPHPGLPAAADARHREHPRPRHARPADARRLPGQRGARRPPGRTRTCWRCWTAGSWPAPRSTCCARSRRRRSIRSGATRRSR